MDYKDIFRPETLAKLNRQSQENLRDMLGNKTIMQSQIELMRLLQEVEEAEAPYKDQLEELAKEMVEKLYPVIEEQGIILDAKIVPMGDVNDSLDEIKVNKPNQIQIPLTIKDGKEYRRLAPSLDKLGYSWSEGKFSQIDPMDLSFPFELHQYPNSNNPKKLIKYKSRLSESITPEGRRRIINGITQGAALKGAFSFYMFKDYLDAIDETLIEKYNTIMKNSFGVYDDDNAIAMMLSMLAQGHKMGGGSSKVILPKQGGLDEIKVNKPLIFDKFPIEVKSESDYNNIIKYLDSKGYKFQEGQSLLSPGGYLDKPFYIYQSYPKKVIFTTNKQNAYDKNIGEQINEGQQDSGITIRARAICFPMLVHEIIKGLYELISLQGFKGDKQQNQQVVDKVDTLPNEMHDIKFGKHIFDALNNIFVNSQYDDPRIREHFFAEIYQLEDDDFLAFVEGAINGDLSIREKKWAEQVMKEIQHDLKGDDYDQEGLDEGISKKGLLAGLLLSAGLSWGQIKPEYKAKIDSIQNTNLNPQQKRAEIQKIVQLNRDEIGGKKREDFLRNMAASGFTDETKYKKYLSKLGKQKDVELDGKNNKNFKSTDCGISKQHAKDDKQSEKKK